MLVRPTRARFPEWAPDSHGKEGNAGRRYGVNPLYLVAHAIEESAFGASEIAQTRNNLFGIAASIDGPNNNAPASTASWFPWTITAPMTAGFAWSYAAASIKRLHDRN